MGQDRLCRISPFLKNGNASGSNVSVAALPKLGNPVALFLLFFQEFSPVADNDREAAISFFTIIVSNAELH